ncbi:plasmid partitioning protein RepB (plasmid) [Pelagibacterium nitratireducens]|jgi:ParB family chromosome partitioning protein|uniref:Plasmid partitioning protein RepB n=1 Tax=Pelagibacterium nitratireducens TaxID=1046114 RepID=A0ABZ2IAP5_9HYPH|tara:strand:+ start:10413 stop:11402 length:990 start_codon:yes stop_codon:yes gene_type:complete
MARKNPFANIMDSGDVPVERPVARDYTFKGASRSLISSIDEMAAQAGKLLEGETIIEVDPDLVDQSFANDRLNVDQEDYEADYAQVLESIRSSGQNSPALLRPHPERPGRYMLVFGRLRWRAATELGLKLRAVIKEISERDHVIAQGQENNARANTSFIEKALFAADIVQRRFDEDNATALAAIGVDRPTLSKMLSVASIPKDLLEVIGRAKAVGRDRWYELKLLLDKPANVDTARALASSSDFRRLPSEARFDAIVVKLKASKPRRRAALASSKRTWAPSDGRVAAEMLTTGRKFTIAIKAKGADATAFGDYLSENLSELYEAFRREK